MVKIIGISGGSGSGKTTIVRQIAEVVPDFVCIAQDSYYKSAEFMDNQHITAFNFDHPSAFDTDLMVEQLRALKRGESIRVPVYDFVHHRRSPETVEVAPRRLVLFEGIMVFVDPRVRELLDLKLYVDTPDDIRFIRRLAARHQGARPHPGVGGPPVPGGGAARSPGVHRTHQGLRRPDHPGRRQQREGPAGAGLLHAGHTLEQGIQGRPAGRLTAPRSRARSAFRCSACRRPCRS